MLRVLAWMGVCAWSWTVLAQAPDAGVDAARDAGVPDASRSSSSDAGAGSDGGADAGAEAGAEADAGAEAEAGSESGSEGESESEAATAEAQAAAEAAAAEAAAVAAAAEQAEAEAAAEAEAVEAREVRPVEPAQPDEDEDDDSPYAPSFELHGEYQFRFHAMSDLGLQTQPRTGFPDELGQNYWATNWLRLTPTLKFGDTFSIVGQMDFFDGVLFGDETVGVTAADRPRDGTTAIESDGFDPRWLYAQWLSPIGMFRAGLQPSHWGLGLLANDGTREPAFGDYRYGNSNVRLFYGTRPFGRDVPLNLVIAGDLVYKDPIANIRDGDRALQAILALLYGDESRGIGAYVVYRTQRTPVNNGVPVGEQIDEELDVWVMDLFARWEWEEPSGGSIFAAFEGLHIRGDTTITRTADNPRQDVRQFMWAAQVGREGDMVDVMLEAGYTSGDSNTEDDVQRRATMHPDHRIGLIMFPEALAWSSARSATLARSELLTGRPSPGSDVLPTDGGVSGATYLFNWASIRPIEQLELRLGWIWARATSDVVDPYRQRAESRSVAWRGGPSSNRDLGVEVDASVLGYFELPHEIVLGVGLEGGVYVPGRAFDLASGERMNTMGMFRVRAGLEF